MALDAPIDQGNGVVTNYHVVETITLNYMSKTTSSVVRSYVDKSYAELDEKLGDKSIGGYGYTFEGLPPVPGDPLDFVYGELKKRSEWSSAGEVAEPVKPVKP